MIHLYQLMPLTNREGLTFEEITGFSQRLYLDPQAAREAAERAIDGDVCLGCDVEERELDPEHLRIAAARYGWHQVGDVAGRLHSDEAKALLEQMKGT